MLDCTVFGEVIDDQVDELDLVLAVVLVVEEVVEDFFCGGSVESDK